MPRPRKIDRPIRLEVKIPQSLHSQLTQELYSEVEGRVPFGALTELFIELTSDWLKSRGLEV